MPAVASKRTSEPGNDPIEYSGRQSARYDPGVDASSTQKSNDDASHAFAIGGGATAAFIVIGLVVVGVILRRRAARRAAAQVDSVRQPDCIEAEVVASPPLGTVVTGVHVDHLRDPYGRNEHDQHVFAVNDSQRQANEATTAGQICNHSS